MPQTGQIIILLALNVQYTKKIGQFLILLA
jgi:hypothetical protein